MRWWGGHLDGRAFTSSIRQRYEFDALKDYMKQDATASNITTQPISLLDFKV